MLGGLIRPGVSFGPEDMRHAEDAPSEPNAAEQLAFRMAEVAVGLFLSVLALAAVCVVVALI